MRKSKPRPHKIHLRLDEEAFRALETNRKKCNLTHLALSTKSGKDIDAEMFWKSRDLIEVAVHELLMQFYGEHLQ